MAVPPDTVLGEAVPPCDGDILPDDQEGWTVGAKRKRKIQQPPTQRAMGRVRLDSGDNTVETYASTRTAPSADEPASSLGGDRVLLDWRREHPDKVEAALSKLFPSRSTTDLQTMVNWVRDSNASHLRAQGLARGKSSKTLSR